MAIKNISTRAQICGRSAKCHGGHSAVEQSSYISREKMYNEYDGNTYYPKYSEDLVHTEVMLPENAPKEYEDASVLWNSVEMIEKSSDAQLARTYKVELPNEWSYELATEVMRDYVKRNFVDLGMCAQFAIHDSENEKTGQRNLHCHILLTMRSIDENGKWMAKQKKVKNEIIDMIQEVAKRNHDRLKLPVLGTKYLRQVTDRATLQSREKMEQFVHEHELTSFDTLKEFKITNEQKYNEMQTKRESVSDRIQYLEALLYLYESYEPFIQYHKEQWELKGFARKNYERKHIYELESYDLYRNKIKQSIVEPDKKITPKAWKKELAQLEKELDETREPLGKVIVNLSSIELLEYNKKELGRMMENEKHQKELSINQSRKKTEQSL